MGAECSVQFVNHQTRIHLIPFYFCPMHLENDLMLRAARGEKTERVPVWLMRQAGRILPEYRAVRASLSGFIELVKTPERAAEVTLQPVDILGVDAAIIFSDILVIPEAMGLPYTMEEKKGPAFPNTIQSESDVDKLLGADAANELGYVYDALSLTKKNLNGRVPLIGFSGAPWTLLAYMVEGGGSKTFYKSKALLYSQPQLAHKLLQKITDAVVAYLKQQVRAGADVLQVFDSWASMLSPECYKEFAMPYWQQIANQVQEVPLTIFAKGAFYSRPWLAALPCRTIGLDWTEDLVESRHLIGSGKTLQGNLDPCILFADEEKIVTETRKMLDKGTAGGPYIANLGHGVYPETDFRKVKLFIETVKAYSVN